MAVRPTKVSKVPLMLVSFVHTPCGSIFYEFGGHEIGRCPKCGKVLESEDIQEINRKPVDVLVDPESGEITCKCKGWSVGFHTVERSKKGSVVGDEETN